MKYTIWRVSSDGSSFPLKSAGETRVKEQALEKARLYNERLGAAELESGEKYIVKDEKGKAVKEEE